MIKKGIESITYLLKKLKEGGKPKPIVLLGAGASISAGIPLANSIKDEILKRFKDKPEIIALKDEEKTYYKLMNCINPSERHKLLREYITKAKINVAHIYLANLLQKEYIDYVLTVNFDDLFLRACALFNFLPPIYDIAILNLKDFTTTSLQEKSITYLHGQHNGFWLLNTKDELDKVRSSVDKILNRICNGRTWIVIGYSGGDLVFERIAELGRFDNDLFWIGYKDDEPIKQVREKLLDKPNTNAYWIPGYDADSFFLKLHSELNLETPEIFNRPFSFLKGMVNNIVNLENQHDYKHYRGVSEGIEYKAVSIENQDYYKDLSKRLELVKQNIDKAIKSFEEDIILNQKELAEINVNKLKQEIIEKIVKDDYNNVEELETKANKFNESELNKLLAVLYSNWGNQIFELAKLNSEESLFLESIEKFEKAIELDPKFDVAFFNFGNAIQDLAKLKKDEALFEESFKKYKKAIELNPNDASAFINWGNAIQELAKLKIKKYPFKKSFESLFEESFEKYRKAIKLNSKQDIVLNNWGLAIFELAKLKKDDKLFKESLEKFEKATNLNPNYADAFYNWGLVEYEFAKFKKDKTLFSQSIKKNKKAIELNHNHAFAYTHWGLACGLPKSWTLNFVN